MTLNSGGEQTDCEELIIPTKDSISYLVRPIIAKKGGGLRGSSSAPIACSSKGYATAVWTPSAVFLVRAIPGASWPPGGTDPGRQGCSILPRPAGEGVPPIVSLRCETVDITESPSWPCLRFALITWLDRRNF